MNQGTAELDGLNIFVIQNGVGHQGRLSFLNPPHFPLRSWPELLQ
jgi:hypothetical protein